MCPQMIPMRMDLVHIAASTTTNVNDNSFVTSSENITLMKVWTLFNKKF